MNDLLIEPRDPLLFRDGKSFAAGLGAASLPFGTPSALAGALRSRLGSGADGRFDSSKIEELLRVEVSGPYLGYRRANDGAAWRLAFPAPADVVVYGRQALRLVPKPEWRGNCDLPAPYLVPLGFSQDPPEGKPTRPPAFWTAAEMQAWLLEKAIEVGGISALPEQRRIHVSIDPAKQAADEGLLYSTRSLEFQSDWGGKEERRQFALACRYGSSSPAGRLPRLSHLGGEGRLAYWSAGGREESIEWPAPAVSKIDRARQGLRLVLATPAVFSVGWRPGWIDAESGEGSPPGFAGLTLRLRAACVKRALPLSGWDYRINKQKPTRWLAPAGSVYFFEIASSATTSGVDALWLQSVCDESQDRLDGFGRVLTGVYSI